MEYFRKLFAKWNFEDDEVLILVVMEYFRKERRRTGLKFCCTVLILVVMEYFRKDSKGQTKLLSIES